jgi:AbrB family looped-hinge helix DNA binding protein
MPHTVSEKGQVTIPKQLRDSLGIVAGTELEFSEEDGRLVARKVLRRNPVDAVYGILDLPAGVDATVEDLRGPVDLP